MKVKNTLANNIETVDNNKVSLDAACKKLLANKIILAWILKNCVEEYKDCTIKEIEEKYIEGTPEISKIAVHRDETAHKNNGAENIEGSRNEDSSMTEGTVAYDIRFNAINPLHENDENESAETGKVMNLIINIEGQAEFYPSPGYPLIKRGIYYGGRMISAQYGTVFAGSHYEEIKKVYSIWVCPDPPKYRSNSINMYSFAEKQLLGKVKEKKENYDLITVIMICLGDEELKCDNALIRLLTVLLSTERSADEKKRILETEFNISMTKEINEEVSDMCDYSNYVEKIGIKKGIEQGIEHGRSETLVKIVESFMKKHNVDSQAACEMLDTPHKEYQKAKALLATP